MVYIIVLDFFFLNLESHRREKASQVVLEEYGLVKYYD